MNDDDCCPECENGDGLDFDSEGKDNTILGKAVICHNCGWRDYESDLTCKDDYK